MDQSYLLMLFAAVLMISTVLAKKPLADDEVENEWQAFKGKHSKNYKNAAEHDQRRGVFKHNLQRINDHNDEDHGYELGVNQFTDMTDDEIKDTVLMKADYVPSDDFSSSSEDDPSEHRTKRQTLPTYVNYTGSGCIPAVKNQGGCGSCWAFASVAALEYYNCKKQRRLKTLSEQQLVDCTYNTTAYGSMGCSGGYTFTSFTYVKDNGGIDSSSSYPYTATRGACNFKTKSVAGTCIAPGYVRVPWNESSLAQAVATVGPVTVLIQALPTFMAYKSGIYNDTACTGSINHAVIVVGYGTDNNGVDYWLIRNSWGTGWGEYGYGRMIRNYYNQCWIATYAWYPTV